MEKKQYADMATIMGFARIFADQIHRCMEHSGLLEQGFEFKLLIQNGKYFENGADISSIELEKSICNTEQNEYEQTRMEQIKIGRKGWEVDYDPIAKTGDVPPVAEPGKAEEVVMEGTGKDSEHPYPPDNLWISSYDYPPHVGGGQ